MGMSALLKGNSVLQLYLALEVWATAARTKSGIVDLVRLSLRSHLPVLVKIAQLKDNSVHLEYPAQLLMARDTVVKTKSGIVAHAAFNLRSLPHALVKTVLSKESFARLAYLVQLLLVKGIAAKTRNGIQDHAMLNLLPLQLPLAKL
jgi:hypothetical protein